jgi:23S rRNA-/tRNA-specific pseudouridylate synthase
MLDVVFEDEDLIAVEKPPGILSHPNPGEDGADSVESQVALRLGKSPTLFHRLDRESSGILLLGKTRRLNAEMRHLFDDHKIRKLYRVVVEGEWPKSLTKLEGVAEDGKEMKSTCRVLASHGDWSLIEVLLKTGRRHQIRLQCRDAGHCVWGDARYGAVNRKHPWIGLHCAELKFQHPLSKREVKIQSFRPRHWRPEWIVPPNPQI